MVPIGSRRNSDKNNNDKVKKETGFISFKSKTPKYSFNDIILSTEVENKIFDILSYKEKSDLVYNEWGLKNTHKYSKKIALNLFGKPGTGKTMTAHAIANYMDKNIIEVNYAEIESKYVGETPKNLTKVFQRAKENDCLLFFDEADAILSKRVTNMSHSTDTSVNQTRSVMLMLLDNYEGFVVFATNFIENFDSAFMRRILAHIFFPLPNYECRKKIWKHLIPEKLPNDLSIDLISKKYDNISGSDISNAILKACFKAARKEDNMVKQKYFEESIKDIIKSKKYNQTGLKEAEINKKIVSEEYAKKQLNIKE